ncbi:hypothetical protein O0547_27310 [Brevibacillus laterosporus]|uniref:hypothetical protein n=1 Tax=Brevibacillus laterosporus TaxID=1465 RepID=UPI0022A70640|nr:hypothetical protein [Brevibacillus laterosporus]MCZ0853267.1 hypothetical protein [Brevibacillus laterosporus]
MKKLKVPTSYERALESLNDCLERRPPRLHETETEVLLPYVYGTIKAVVDAEMVLSAQVQTIKNYIKASDDITSSNEKKTPQQRSLRVKRTQNSITY